MLLSNILLLYRLFLVCRHFLAVKNFVTVELMATKLEIEILNNDSREAILLVKIGYLGQ